jgi:hypothetical protein
LPRIYSTYGDGRLAHHFFVMENLLPPKEIIKQRIADMAKSRLKEIIESNPDANLNDLFPFAYEKEYELFKEKFDLLMAFIK